jgi:hypothetical protein
MIKVTTEKDKLVCIAELNGRLGVYLDNDSLIELATGAKSRRQRFLDALAIGGDLLFSYTNAVEIAGPQGKTATAIRSFLDDVKSYWTPLGMNPWEVAWREANGFLGQAPVSESFMKAYCEERIYDLREGHGEVLDLSADSFFRLSSVLDWVQEHRDDIRGHAGEVDLKFCSLLKQLRDDHDKNQSALDREAPPVPLDHQRPATFVLNHLLRMLVLEANAFHYKKNDGLDFCHAVLASAYGSMITLDKQWKRRVENLPSHNRLAKVYYRPQVDELVNLLEGLTASR